jgi:hypothetical protein
MDLLAYNATHQIIKNIFAAFIDRLGNTGNDPCQVRVFSRKVGFCLSFHKVFNGNGLKLFVEKILKHLVGFSQKRKYFITKLLQLAKSYMVFPFATIQCTFEDLFGITFFGQIKFDVQFFFHGANDEKGLGSNENYAILGSTRGYSFPIDYFR